MADLRKVKLVRFETDDLGTFGKLSTGTFECYTVELPWRNNDPGKSCIPNGTYKCSWRTSTKHGECYGVNGVAGRSDIEIHSANWAGDESKGYKCQLLGCIAPGRAIMDIAGQKGVSSSRDTLDWLVADLEKEAFELTISSEVELK